MNKKNATLNVNVPFDIATGQLTGPTSTVRGRVMSMLAGQYAALSNGQKSEWNLINNPIQTIDTPQHDTVLGANGWTAYYSCNSILYKTGQPLVSSPVPVNKPANLPLLNAAVTTTGPIHDKSFVVTLSAQSDAAYPAGPTLAIWASQGTPQGNGRSMPDKWRAKAYFFLGNVTGGLPTDGIDVTTLYTDVLGPIPASCRIGFKVMAINTGGYHSDPAFTFALVPAQLAMSSQETGDDGNNADDDLHVA